MLRTYVRLHFRPLSKFRMPSVKLQLSAILLVIWAFNACMCFEAELTIYVEPGQKECFHQHISKDTKFEVEYQVRTCFVNVTAYDQAVTPQLQIFLTKRHFLCDGQNTLKIAITILQYLKKLHVSLLVFLSLNCCHGKYLVIWPE